MRRKSKRKKGRVKAPIVAVQPSAGIGRELLRTALVNRAQESQIDFLTLLQDAFALVQSFEPLNFLAVAGFYGAAHAPHQVPDARIVNPVNIELAQAFCLTILETEAALKPSTMVQFGEFACKVNNLRDSFHRRRFADIPKEPDQATHRLLMIESVRSITQGIRNWSTPEEIEKITAEIVAQIDPRFKTVYGIAATELCSTLSAFQAIFERRVQAWQERFQRIFVSRDFRAQTDAYSVEFPGDIDSAAWADGLKNMNLSPKVKRAILRSRADMHLHHLFRYTSRDLSEESSVSWEVFERLLQLLSHRFGSLADSNSEHFFLANPVWHRPFIHLADGEFFLPCPNLLTSHRMEILEFLASKDKALKKAFEDARAAYLEVATAELLGRMFPRGSVVTESLFEMDGIGYENDIAVVVDDTLLIVECKSAKVLPASRRGAEKSIADNVTALILEPDEQAKRFAAYLMSERKSHSLPKKNSTQTNEIDTSAIETVICFSVCLEFLGGLGVGTSLLRQAGIMPADRLVQPVLSLADLRWVERFLDLEMLRLDYLHQRQVVEADWDYFGDEMDLIALYLDNQFNLPATSSFLYGKSIDLENYLHGLANQVQIPRPSLQVTRDWMKLLNRTDKMAQGWFRAARCLLRRDRKAQKEIVKTLKLVTKRARKESSVEGVYWEAHGRKKQAIICASHFGMTRTERNNAIAGSLEDARKAGDFDEWAVLCTDAKEGLFDEDISEVSIFVPRAGNGESSFDKRLRGKHL